MTWEQEIQLAVERERDRNEKIIEEKNRKIAELEARLAAVSGAKPTA
ncbi:MAG: hypothetical protein MJY78_01510 [Fibrobacter sp.]|nr:hypothetical protein [Fibrobacter sp.]